MRKQILALLLSLTFLCTAISGHSQAAVPSVRWTHLYETFNADYFNNKLPANLIVYSGPAHGDMGVTWKDDDWSAVEIELNPTYNNTERTAALSLLHEMCHVQIAGTEVMEHGPKWQACMMNLAKQGAFAGIW